MDFSTYDKERLTNQIDRYDKKSQKKEPKKVLLRM